MAALFYVYSRSSIKAAKRNAQMHREADGGQINWQNENLRRHGMLEKPGGQKGVVGELVALGTDKGVERAGAEGKNVLAVGKTKPEEEIRARRVKKGGD